MSKNKQTSYNQKQLASEHCFSRIFGLCILLSGFYLCGYFAALDIFSNVSSHAFGANEINTNEINANEQISDTLPPKNSRQENSEENNSEINNSEKNTAEEKKAEQKDLPQENAKPTPSKPTERETRSIEGWTVRIDKRLLDSENQELGEKAIKILSQQLFRISEIFPKEKLEWLRHVPIVLDLTHGELIACQYHPSKDWLVQNGYAADLEKTVHLPSAKFFTDPKVRHDQPFVLLHELAHAYHDQALGFENQNVEELWKKAVESKKYETTLHIDGGRVKHYALENSREFFSEMTETVFGQNDFYPFVAGELKEEEPEVFETILALWFKVKLCPDCGKYHLFAPAQPADPNSANN